MRSFVLSISKNFFGFLFGACITVAMGSLPTIVIDPIVSSIYFLIYGEWHSPINVELVKFVTFRFDTSLLGVDLILNKVLTLQTETWGRIYLTGIMIIPTVVVVFGGRFLHCWLAEWCGVEVDDDFECLGFYLADFAFGILMFPGILGGVLFGFFWFVTELGLA
jgi:hypothetical protein